MGRPPTIKITKGQRFGRLTARDAVVRRGRTHWICDCDCGQAVVVPPHRLSSGETKSCGCLKREFLARGQIRHGYARPGRVTPEYRAWRNMLERCHGNHPHGSTFYQPRGIRVCDQWRASFETFLADVGSRPSPRHSLDRYPDNNGNYEPGNVRWATLAEQARNKRDNVVVRVDGVEMTLTDAATLAGLPLVTVSMRLIRLGWSIERALGLGAEHAVEMVGRRGGRPRKHRSSGDAS